MKSGHTSTNVLGSAYDTKSKRLSITFKGMRTYVYSNVPKKIYTDLRNAESKGSYVNKHIAYAFEYSRVI